MSGKKDKRRPSPAVPPRKNPPRALPGLPDSGSSGDRLCWRFRHVDHEGPWSFDRMTGAELCELMKTLASFETMTMSEAFNGSGQPGKDYNVEDIPTKEARDRLEAIRLPDMTKISVFRLSGVQRLYGFRCENVFHVVWWDPFHQIWPSPKKHT
jgi:hypothetical protein